MQIPVAGGFRGGNFYLKNGTQQSKLINTSRNCHKAFHVTAFYDDSQIFREPITKGTRIELVFNLRHKGTAITSGIARPLSEDHDSPFYRIWQSPNPQSHDVKTENSNQLSKKEKVLTELFRNWKKTEHSRVELYAIPLDHSYCKSSLSFKSLKGIDRSMADMIVALLGNFVEVHLATVTKYVGFTENDWMSSGREHVVRKTQGKSPKHFNETDWTEYFAGNWIDLHNRRLTLPPLSLSVPDELLGINEAVFHSNSINLTQEKFDGYAYDRAAIIIWPRNQAFSTAVCFGLDQALDVVEHQSKESDLPFSLTETKKSQMLYLLALCKKEPNKSWYVSTLDCDDLRCDRAIPVSLQVAYKRALRLINLCLLWNLPECGLELLRILFCQGVSTDYRCFNCSTSDEEIFFVGGICSNQVAEKLGELIVLLDWNSTVTRDCLKQLINDNMVFDLKQIGQLAHLAVYLFNHQCFEAAIYISDQAFRLLVNLYLVELPKRNAAEKVVESFINMLILIDGLSSSDNSRLMKLLFQLKDLSVQHTSLVIGWLQQTDETILRSCYPYWDFYIDLVTNLESQLMDYVGFTNKYGTSFSKLEQDAAQLMTSIVRMQNTEKLKMLTEKIISSMSQEGRILLAAVISSKNVWAVPSSPSIETTLISLSAVRVQQLIRFKFPMFKWEQPDAILKDHPEVEAFLHSTKECLTYDSFANEEEARAFVSKYFCHPYIVTGYSAKVSEIVCHFDGRVSIKISKSLEIYESSMRQLEMLEAALSGPSLSFSLAKSEGEEPIKLSTSDTPICEATEPKESPSTKRLKVRARKRGSVSAPPEKRSKRISFKNVLKQGDQEVLKQEDQEESVL